MNWDGISLDEQFLAAMQCSFACDRCGKCCQMMNGIAYNSVDCQRMAKQLNLRVTDFMRDFTTASSKKAGDRWLILQGEQKKCPFLGDRGCSQYLGRGQVCRFYPWFSPENVNPVRLGKPFKVLVNCSGMVRSTKYTIQMAEEMSFKKAEQILKMDFGKICWLHMMVDEGKEDKAKKFANELGYANLPGRVDSEYWGRAWAASYLVMMGPRKLENLKAEIEKYAVST
jgi:Fe-S-cluster containining protein